MIARYALALVFLAAAYGEDAGLAALSATLHALRTPKTEPDQETRGATPQLTTAKHQLRDWIEARLPGPYDQSPVAWKLNQELKQAGLICDAPNTNCDMSKPFGYVQPVSIEREDGQLIARTGVGILCGFDESAYIYQWKQNGWARRWQYEHNDYTPGKYVPETLYAVLIAPTYKSPQPLVLTLASRPWCTSNWNSAIYSLWRLGPDEASAQLLLSKREGAFLDPDPPIMGSVGSRDALIQFTSPSLDCERLARTAVRHYQVDGDRVARIAPLAVNPRDFVEEWLAAPWSESAAWSERELRDWHKSPEACTVKFRYPVMHCPSRPDTWQIVLDNKGGISRYFLVRWRPPYEFSMVDVRSDPWPECNQPDRLDLPYPAGTLFPVQPWRR